MTAQQLGAAATARPNPTAEDQQDCQVLTFISEDCTNCAFIVYAVNHIEQAEADLAEATRLLDKVLREMPPIAQKGQESFYAAVQEAVRFLAAHAEQGEGL